jgi:carbamoyltransferase
VKRLHLGIYLGGQGSAGICVNGVIKVAMEESMLSLLQTLNTADRQSHSNTQHDIPYQAIQYCLDALYLKWTDLTHITVITPYKNIGLTRNHLLLSDDSRVQLLYDIPKSYAYHAYYNTELSEALILVVNPFGHVEETFTHAPRQTHYTLYHAREDTFHILYEDFINQHLYALNSIVHVYYRLAQRAAKYFQIVVSDQHLVNWFSRLASYGDQQANLRPWFNNGSDDFQIKISSYDLWLELQSIEDYIVEQQLMTQMSDEDVDLLTKRIWADLAYKAQSELIQAMVNCIDKAIQKTGCHHLCVAGSFTSDSVMNTALQHIPTLDTLYIAPGSDLTKVALGAIYQQETKEALHPLQNRCTLEHARFGKTYSVQSYQQALQAFAGILSIESLTQDLINQRFANEIIEGKVIARYDSVLSISQHVSSSRLLVCDPSQRHAVSNLNTIGTPKNSFAPTVLICPEDRCIEFFEKLVRSPLGLLLATPQSHVREYLAPILRPDGRICVLTIHEDSDLQLLNLCESLSQYHERPPLLLATPFQQSNGQMIDRPSEAVHWMIGTDAQAMIMGNAWITPRLQTYSRRDFPYNSHTTHSTSHSASHSTSHITSSTSLHDIFEQKQEILPLLFNAMQSLDYALFHPYSQSTRWSHSLLKTLSHQLAAYRSQSLLFKEHPLGIPFTPQLSSGITALVNPWGKSLMIDDRETWPPRLYDWNKMTTLVTVLFNRDHSKNSLQAQLSMPHYEVQEYINWARAELESYGLSASNTWLEDETPYEVIELRTDPLFAALKDPNYSIRPSLKKLWKVLYQAHYNENNLSAFHKEGIPQPLGEGKLADLIRLFMLNQPLSKERVMHVLTPDLAQELNKLSILKSGSLWRSQIHIDHIDHMYIASDIPNYINRHGDESPCLPLDDLQRGFIRLNAGNKGGTTLDASHTLGALAIQQARHGFKVSLMVPNERSLRFIHFNLQLNGVQSEQLCIYPNISTLNSSPFDQIFMHHSDLISHIGAHLKPNARIYMSSNHLPIGRDSLASKLHLVGRSLILPIIKDQIKITDPRLYQGFSHAVGYWVFESHTQTHRSTPAPYSRSLVSHRAESSFHEIFYRPLQYCPRENLGTYIEHYFNSVHWAISATHHQSHRDLLLSQHIDQSGSSYHANHTLWPSMLPIILTQEIYTHLQKLISQAPYSPWITLSDLLVRLGFAKAYQSISLN